MACEESDHPVLLLGPQVRFLTACSTGDCSQLAESLACHTLEVNTPGQDGLTGLMLAARGGHTEVVVRLLARRD